MDKPNNPFVIQGYFGDPYFCDRKDETQLIRRSLKNGMNISMISSRRMGKTALIHHAFGKMSGRKIFIDLWTAQSAEDLVRKMGAAIFTQYKKPSTNLLKTLGSVFKSLQIGLTLNDHTGSPEMTFDINPKSGPLPAIVDLFNFLRGEPHQFYIALDEFQQVARMPETNIEAMLREQIQLSKNIHFIFAGSHKGMMTAIFSSHTRPFYQSATPLYLEKIDPELYADFVQEHFQSGHKSLNRKLVMEAIDWCNGHTYHLQYFFNRLYSIDKRKYDGEDIRRIQHSILKEREPEFAMLKNLLGKQHWRLLLALAHEQPAQKMTSGKMIRKYELSAASTVSQNLKSLVAKNLIELTSDGYMLNDIFFARWLQKFSPK